MIYHRVGERPDSTRPHEFSTAIHETTADDVADRLAEYYHADVAWHGPAPIDDLHGRDAVAGEFWKPLLTAFPDLERNDYVLFGGEFEDGE